MYVCVKAINESRGGVLRWRGTEGSLERSDEEALKNRTLSSGSEVSKASARTGTDCQQL